MNKLFLSIIIPAFNEKANFLKGVLDQIVNYLQNINYPYEVLIVDDGSTDGSVDLLDKFCQEHKHFSLIKNSHMGKSGTIASGVKHAQGEYILFTDFDQATPISEFEKLLTYLEKGYDIVIGSREVTGAKRDAEPWYRHLMGKGFNFGVKLIAVPGIQDTQCGFKAFRTEVAKNIFTKLQVYKPKEISNAFTGAFDVEILFIARKLDYKIAEVPINWSHVETNRVSPLRDSFLMALDVIKIRLYYFLGFYR